MTTQPGSELRRLRALVADLDAIVWEADVASGRFTFVSQRAEDLLGWPRRRWTSEPSFWADHVHPDDRERIVSEFITASTQGRAHDLEYRFLAKDGRVVWLRDIGHTVPDHQGRPSLVRGIMVDITRQKLTEESHQEAEQRFRLLVEQLPGMVYIGGFADDPTQPAPLRYISPQVEQILGFSAEEWLSNPTEWWNQVYPEDRERMHEEYRRAVDSGSPYAADYRLISRDGRTVWIHDEAVVVTDDDGSPLFWQGVLLDTTSQREADQRATESEDKYRSLVERIPAMVYLESMEKGNDTIFYISPQVEQILGVSQEAWVGDQSTWFRTMHPEDRARVEEENRIADETLQPFSSEYRMIASEGRIVWIHDEAVVVRDESGDPRFWHGVMLDITERKRAGELERELATEREEASELRALDEMKNTFLQAVSHDLRTPLAAILGLAVTLEREDVELHPDEAKDLAGRIAANARKLDRMVADLLDLDRLSRGIVEPNLFPTDLGALVTRIVTESESLNSRKVTLEIEPVMAEVDATKVERIVENLLANTTRHTPPDAPVWIRVCHEGDGVLIAVEDAGPGISAEHREEIFEPFRQGPDTPEHSPGVGIGLALVARFAELHGGHAWVEDRSGGGASFKVFLPKKPPSS
jgi:PAS domain S-box-containing protein